MTHAPAARSGASPPATPKLMMPATPCAIAASRAATSRDACSQITETPGPKAIRASNEREVTAMTAVPPAIADAPASTRLY